MRHAAASLALAALSACAVPNPAYFATQGGSDGSTAATMTAGTGNSSTSAATVDPATTDGSASGSTSVSTTISTSEPTTDPTTHTSDTTGPVDPSTSGPMTSTSTTLGTDSTSTGANSTDAMSTGVMSTSNDTTDGSGGILPQLDFGQMMDLCQQVAAPDLALSVQHVPAPENCVGQLLHGVYVGKADADSLIFRQCKSTDDCLMGNINCLENQTLTIHFAGPTTHVPVFDGGACVQIGYVGTGYENANTCDAKFVRLGRTGPNVATTSVYVGATGVPDTSVLPAPWPTVLEFSVKAALLDECGPGNPVCGQVLGDYQLVGTFPDGQVTVPYKSEKAAKVPLLDQQDNHVGDIPGTLYNLRSWARPIDACEFKWIWLADDNKPG